jgi:hypothetical protein
MSTEEHEELPEMTIRPTPPLSAEGMAEVAAELDAPPADTPERRATFARARAAAFLVEQAITQSIRRK